MDNASHELKKNLIYEYRDNIEIKKHYDKKKRQGSVEIIKINFRSNKISDFFLKFENSLVTSYLEFEDGFATVEKMGSIKDTNEYIEQLRRNYNIRVQCINEDEEIPNNPNLVKIFFSPSKDIVNRSQYVLVYV